MDYIILSKVAKYVHPSSCDMIQTVMLSLALLTMPSYGQVPLRRAATPVKVEDPTVAPHIPKLQRMSTMSEPKRAKGNLPVPHFLRDLQPVRVR